MTSVTINKFNKQTYQSPNSLHAWNCIHSSSEILYLAQGVSCCLSLNTYRRVSLALKSLHLMAMWDKNFFLIRSVFEVISNLYCLKHKICYVNNNIKNTIVGLSKHTTRSCHRRFFSTSATSSQHAIAIETFVLASIPM